MESYQHSAIPVMDQDISRWLKNDLGLVHMSEADINCLMFHPRHGSLCRRFIKFLVESTLCAQRYPNVYVKEENTMANNELEDKSRILSETMANFEVNLRSNENEMQELNFLMDKLDYLTKIEELQRISSDAFEAMASRANFNLEQVSNLIQNPDYLGNLDLEDIYSIDDEFKMETVIGTRQMAALDETFDELLNSSKIILRSVLKILEAILSKMDNLDRDLDITRVNIENLLALKMPESEEVVIEADEEEKQLKEQGTKLWQNFNDLNQQVADLSDQYKCKKVQLNKHYKDELRKDLTFLKTLQDLEMSLHERPRV